MELAVAILQLPLAILQFTETAGRAFAIKDDIGVYQAILETVTEDLSEVDSIRNKLSAWGTIESLARMDRKIQRARSDLENARKITDGKECHGLPKKLRRLKWFLVDSHSAKLHKEILVLHHQTLLFDTRPKLTQMRQIQLKWDAYSRETQYMTHIAMGSRIKKKAVMYSGEAEHQVHHYTLSSGDGVRSISPTSSFRTSPCRVTRCIVDYATARCQDIEPVVGLQPRPFQT